MFGWLSWAASLASSMNMLMKSVLPVMYGRIFLIATVFWNPSTPRMRAFHTSAMPPTAMRSSSVYCPKVSPAGSGVSRGTIWMRWVASELSPPGSTLPVGAGGGGATRGAPAAAAGGAPGREGGAGAWEASPGRDDGSTLRPAFAISSISDRAIAPVIRRRTPVPSAAAGGDDGGPAGGGPAGDGGAGRAGAGPAAAAEAAAGGAGGTAGAAAGTEAAAGTGAAGGAAATGTAGAVGLAGATALTGGAGGAATGGGMGLAGAAGDEEGGDTAAAGWA